MLNLNGALKLEVFLRFLSESIRQRHARARERERDKERKGERESKETEENDLTFKHGRV